MNLEFGGGEKGKLGFTQVDIRKINDDTIVCNAWQIKKYIKNNSINNIYSRHFIEHLTTSQMQKTLNAWYEICKKGANITIICPNTDAHISQWLNWEKLSAGEKRHCRAGFWGWQREADKSSWDIHKSGYNYNILKELLEQHKFINVKNLGETSIKNFHLKVSCNK